MGMTMTSRAYWGTIDRRNMFRLAVFACAGAALAPMPVQAYSITGTYNNYGTWNDSLYVMTTGQFINMPGGVIQSSMVTNVGKLENRAGGVINNYTRLMNAVAGQQREVLYNYGTITNFAGGSFENYAPLLNYAGATLTTQTGATFANWGLINNVGNFSNAGVYTQTWGNITGAPARKLTNSGEMSNSGTMTIGVNTLLDNTGVFNNSGTVNGATAFVLTGLAVNLATSGTWNNSGALNITGTLGAGYTASNRAYLTNTGTLNNTGTLTNVNATVRNYATLVNDGTIANTTSNYVGDWGRFYNYAGASFVNHATFSTNHILDNYGTITNTGSLSATYMLNNLAGATLSNAPGATLGGAAYNYGTLDNRGGVEVVYNYGVLQNRSGAAQNGLLSNNGTLTNEAGASLAGYLDMTNAAGATLINHGTMNHWHSDWWPATSSNAGTLLNDGSINNARTLTNSGTLTNTGTLAGSGSYLQTAGVTTNDGSLTQATINIQGGSFIHRAGSLRATTLTSAGIVEASGILDVASFSNAGRLAVGGSTIARLNINGSYAQAAGGALLLQLAGLQQGTEYDTLIVAGPMMLAGTLNVGLQFEPVDGAQFDLVHADGGITGSFENLELPILAAGLGWYVDYTATDLRLQVITVPEPTTCALLGLGVVALGTRRRRF